MEEKISIIMSAYNSSKTIGRAIESCLNQTYNNFELLIVNDCSTDNTLDIINSYNDNRIRVINHDENKGAGWARYTGVKEHKGNYTVFLDSDDYLMPTCLEHQLKALKDNNAEITSISYTIEYPDNKDKNYNLYLPYKVCEGLDKFSIDNPNADKFLNGVMIKSNIWDKVEYCKRRFVEDTPTIVKCIHYANKLVKLPTVEYVYTQNEGSLIHTADDIKTAIYCAVTAIDNYNFAKEVDLEPFKDLNIILIRIKTLSNIGITDKHRNLYKEELSIIAQFLINHLS